MDARKAGASLIKQLASCHKPTRDKALYLLLNTWLPAQTQISDNYMKKLWKGLFYCIWHADKLPIQAQLIQNLSSLLPSLPLPLSIHYFSVFLQTMRSEWAGIDALRLDKFYLLIRTFLRYFFEIFKKHSWDLEIVNTLVNALIDKCFIAEGRIKGDGVNYHVVSIFVEELSPFLPLRKEVVEEVFGPFISLMRKAQDKVLLGKIKSGVFEVLLKMGKKLLGMKKSGCEADLADDVMKLGTTAMLMGFSAKFFEFGSSVECFQGNRTVLFGLHEEFLKLEKDLESSEIVISIPEVNDDVPNLVPVSSDMEVDESAGCAVSGSASKVLKKCKKAKVSVSNEQKEKKRKKNKKINLFSEFGIENGTSDKEKENVVSTACDILNDKHRADENLISFDQSTLSNLQLQFEKVAAEVGLDSCVESACDLPKITVNETVTKKRKRVKSANGQQSQNPETDQVDGDVDLSVKSREKSAKKVRFSMKNNLVWKPQSPLPPQSLRLPPSVTPRGSALKKGVPPGPIREMPLAIKKAKQRSKSAKKVRNVIKLVNPAHKSVKKLKSCSTQ
ncbi:ribosomal RNA processing protein 1 homolog isoform X1 [Mangifera indica]|uniref:ribosomal RNA processing protein 1 homolog isoform X1 n=1 Tax=Mangifera indica TaxID=29780 RepID=UPI001CFB2E6A|nr:ribosomal RNA processing protein 1 homolog isoform X1 [Mangifera indica]